MFEQLKLIGGSMVAAPLLVLDAPATLKLRVNTERRNAIRRPTLADIKSSIRHGELITDPHPPTIVIHLDQWDETYGAWRDAGAIVINTCALEIDWGYSQASLLGKHRHGSGAIGVLAIGLPAIIFSTPLLVLGHSYYRLLEKSHQMSRHAIALREALAGQLDIETERTLVEALKWDWQTELPTVNDPLQFCIAQSIINKLTLFERRLTSKHGLRHDLFWIDDQDYCLAEGYFEDGIPHIRVGRREFTGPMAAELLTFYRTKLTQSINR